MNNISKELIRLWIACLGLAVGLALVIGAVALTRRAQNNLMEAVNTLEFAREDNGGYCQIEREGWDYSVYCRSWSYYEH